MCKIKYKLANFGDLKMLIKNIQPTKFFVLLLLIFTIFLSGCTSRFASEQEAAPQTKQPETPPAPVVVDGVRTSYADFVQKTSPAVVKINSERKAKVNFQRQIPFDAPQAPRNPEGPNERGVGSGVIVSADGTILTNHHVIEDAVKITVQMNDGKTFEAKMVGSDPPSDLAVLNIEAEELPFLDMGNSDEVRIGDIVLAIGNPLGIGQTVTSGIISAKGRQTNTTDSFQDFLQTDAPINQGNSGGALVNVKGELIGINSQILSRSGGNIGIGFAIPSNMAKSVMEQLLTEGKVRRGRLGVGIQPLTETLAEKFKAKDIKGVLVNQVMEDSAAEKAGIKSEDIIISINGEATEDPNSLRNKVAGTKPGTEIKLTILRDGEEKEVSVTLDEFEVAGNTPTDLKDGNDSEKMEQNKKLGLSLQPVTPEIAKQLELNSDSKGLVVTQIAPNGAVAEAGIQRGDVILGINRQEVNSLNDVQSAIEKSGDNPILLLVERKGRTFFLTVTPK